MTETQLYKTLTFVSYAILKKIYLKRYNITIIEILKLKIACPIFNYWIIFINYMHKLALFVLLTSMRSMHRKLKKKCFTWIFSQSMLDGNQKLHQLEWYCFGADPCHRQQGCRWQSQRLQDPEATLATSRENPSQKPRASGARPWIQVKEHQHLTQ